MTSNYPKGIAVYDPTHMVRITDHVAVSVETLGINSGYSLKK